MNLSNELALLRKLNPALVIPGIDTVTGFVDPGTGLTGLSQFSRASQAPVHYNPATNTVSIISDGIVLKNVDFGSATVSIYANNVVLINCKFTNSTGWYSVIQNKNSYGAVIENCTFNTTQPSSIGAYIGSYNDITVNRNSFLNCSNDGVDLQSGTVTNNYFTGGGLSKSATHSDAVWVGGSLGPVLIANNFVDFTSNPNTLSQSNDCIRITTEVSSVDNVTVDGNILIGGATGIDAGSKEINGTFSNITIKNNYIGFNTHFSFYPGLQAGVTASNNVVFDFTNPIYSQQAWQTYLANGILTDSLITATASTSSIGAASTGTTTLYGGSVSGARLFGGKQETIIIGGAGSQYTWGGTGRDIYSYLSPGDSTIGKSDSLGNFDVAKDLIDLHSIDADPLVDGLTNFKFIGSNAFSSSGGEVRVVLDTARNQTLVDVTFVGSSTVDLEIRVGGLLNLTAGNFLLTNDQFKAAVAPYATQPWTKYLVDGIFTNSLVTASSSTSNSIQAAVTGTTTLYGSNIVGAYLFGGKQETIIIGGAGSQYTWGGTGRDIYSYLSVSDSAIGKSDLVGNFDVAKDLIDLHSIDANPLVDGMTNFKFIGSKAFSSSGGEVRVILDTARNQTLVDVSLVGRSTADLEIRVGGLLNLTAANFALTSDQFIAAIAPYTTVADFASYQAQLDGVAGGFSIMDSSANVFGNLAALQADAANINAITLTDASAGSPPVLVLSATDAASDAAVLADIVSPYVLVATASDGVSTIAGHGDGLTIKIGAGVNIVTGGGTNETFYFASNFGSATITDFGQNYANSSHDTIALATTDFANWSSLVASGHASGVDNRDTTFVGASGATLTLTGVAYSLFAANDAALRSDFKFHA